MLTAVFYQNGKFKTDNASLAEPRRCEMRCGVGILFGFQHGNQIADAGAGCLADALKADACPALQWLDLYKNKIPKLFCSHVIVSSRINELQYVHKKLSAHSAHDLFYHTKRYVSILHTFISVHQVNNAP